MHALIKGIDIVVIHHIPTEETDIMGEPVYREVREQIHNVLWEPGSAMDLPEADRPNGDVDTIKLHFPKTYDKSLAGCDVEINDLVYQIQGDPQGYLSHLTPGQWNRPVIAKRVVG